MNAQQLEDLQRRFAAQGGQFGGAQGVGRGLDDGLSLGTNFPAMGAPLTTAEQMKEWQRRVSAQRPEPISDAALGRLLREDSYNPAAGLEDDIPRDPRVRSVAQLEQTLLDKYFQGQASPVFDQNTGQNYGTELRIHDAAHQFANIGTSLRGENQQTIVDSFGNVPVSGTGQMTQEWTSGGTQGRDAAYLRDVGMTQIDNAAFNRTMVQLPDGTGSSQFRDYNNPGALLSPPIEADEVRELQRRGAEFYSQLRPEFERARLTGTDLRATPQDVSAARGPFGPLGRPVSDKDVFIRSLIESSPDFRIRGGYDAPGRMPYGPMEQLLNPPLVPTVDADDYQQSWSRAVDGAVEKVGRSDPSRADRQRFPDSADTFSPHAAGLDVDSYTGDLGNYPGRATARGAKDGVTYLNPPTLGSNVSGRGRSEIGNYLSGDEVQDVLLESAAAARDRGRMRQALRAGSTVGMGLGDAGSLYDPAIQRAVEQGRPLEAAGRYLGNQVVGGATGLAIGAGAQAARQAAPAPVARAIAAAAPAAAVAGRLANPLMLAAAAPSSRPLNYKEAPVTPRTQQRARQAVQTMNQVSRRRQSNPFELGVSEALGIPNLGIRKAGQRLMGLFGTK
jgi:hypothetical protein